MSKLFIISEEEKNRILNLHETATKHHYLKKTIEEILLREDDEALPNMENIPLGKVESVQQALVDAGYYIGPTGVDGVFGKNTRSAVLKYQKDNGIKQTGNVGPLTAGKLGVQQLTSIKPSQSTTKNSVKPVDNKTIPKNSVKSVVSTDNKTIPKNNDKSVQKQYCEAFPKTPDVNSSLIPKYQTEAGNLISLGIPPRTACEISFIKIRPKFNGKSFFVVDTLQNLIYLFDSSGKFVAKSQTLDGEDAQSQDVKKIAEALWSWQEQVEKMGFKWDPSKQKYLDKTSKNRTYDEDLVYNEIDKNNTRFFPKGIYSISGLGTDDDYIGGDNNIFSLQTLDGKQIAQAIHGFYNEPPRVAALEQLKKSMGTNLSSPKVPQEFLNLVGKYVNTSKFNKSYGCINLPADFLKKARPYAKKGTLVFVIGETNKNFLVQNGDNFFDKMGNGQQCTNPTSLGVELPQIDAVA